MQVRLRLTYSKMIFILRSTTERFVGDAGTITVLPFLFTRC